MKMYNSVPSVYVVQDLALKILFLFNVHNDFTTVLNEVTD